MKYSEILGVHDGPKCSKECWATYSRPVANHKAGLGSKESTFGRKRETVKMAGNTILGCTCDYYQEQRPRDGCKHIQYLLSQDWRGCMRFVRIDDGRVIQELRRECKIRWEIEDERERRN